MYFSHMCVLNHSSYMNNFHRNGLFLEQNRTKQNNLFPVNNCHVLYMVDSIFMMAICTRLIHMDSIHDWIRNVGQSFVYKYSMDWSFWHENSSNDCEYKRGVTIQSSAVQCCMLCSIDKIITKNEQDSINDYTPKWNDFPFYRFLWYINVMTKNWCCNGAICSVYTRVKHGINK